VAFLVGTIAIALVLLAVAPYVSRRRGTSADTDEGRSKRLVVILLVVALAGAGNLVWRLVANDELDARERDLRHDLEQSSGRLQQIRSELVTSTQDDARPSLAGITDSARLRYHGLDRSDTTPMLDAEVSWTFARRCFAISVEPGGRQWMVEESCR
jgi:hypothetical protein